MVGFLEIGREPGELGSEPSAGAMQPGLDRGDGDAQPLGQLAGAEAFGVLEDQQLGVALREPAKGALDELLTLVPHQPGERRGRAVGPG